MKSRAATVKISGVRKQRGFTLVEVAVAVVIIGVLSVIGVVSYRRYTAASRLSEATKMIAGITAAENEWMAERGTYFNVSDNSGAFYPSPNPGPFVTRWGGPCGNCRGNPHAWEDLKV